MKETIEAFLKNLSYCLSWKHTSGLNYFYTFLCVPSLFSIFQTLKNFHDFWKMSLDQSYFRGQKLSRFLRFWPIFAKGKKLDETFANSKNCVSFFLLKIRREHKEKCRNSLVLMYAFKTDNETNFLKMLR